MDLIPDRNVRYIRQFPNIPNHKTGRPLEYQIDHRIALYILDGADKEQRLKASSRDQPCVSYTGQSCVWREKRDGIAQVKDDPPCERLWHGMCFDLD